MFGTTYIKHFQNYFYYLGDIACKLKIEVQNWKLSPQMYINSRRGTDLSIAGWARIVFSSLFSPWCAKPSTAVRLMPCWWCWPVCLLGHLDPVSPCVGHRKGAGNGCVYVPVLWLKAHSTRSHPGPKPLPTHPALPHYPQAVWIHLYLTAPVPATPVLPSYPRATTHRSVCMKRWGFCSLLEYMAGKIGSVWKWERAP